MRKHHGIFRGGVAALALALVIPAGISAPAHAAADIKIGIITSTSGPLKSYGDAYNDGLDWGLKYYTAGSMKVGGAKLVVTKKDDGGDPAAATAFFKEMVGNGTKIIAGTASSGVALTLGPLAQQNKILYISGPAKNDGVTSATNKYVFRSGNTSLQDFAPLSNIKPISGKKVILFVEDNAFGAGNSAAAKLFLSPKGAILEDIKVATTATDFTPYAKKAADANGAYIFVAWSNALTAGAMFTALRQQGVFAKTRPITGLAGVASYDIYGTIFDGANAVLTNSYFPGVVKTPTSIRLAADYAKQGISQDLFTSDGVNAAKMIVQALQKNAGVDIDTAIANLEGFRFIGLKGIMTIRASDHVLVQPMFIVKLVKDGAHFKPVLVSTLRNVAH
ncbi:MAG: ABC transporter substrate-binding protein [Candidatus Nanopelagicaceae bacterium]|nr:ABC transporter substrate-binding protein [Candidatus Nanopelagicaceae bacterium]